MVLEDLVISRNMVLGEVVRSLGGVASEPVALSFGELGHERAGGAGYTDTLLALFLPLSRRQDEAPNRDELSRLFDASDVGVISRRSFIICMLEHYIPQGLYLTRFQRLS